MRQGHRQGHNAGRGQDYVAEPADGHKRVGLPSLHWAAQPCTRTTPRGLQSSSCYRWCAGPPGANGLTGPPARRYTAPTNQRAATTNVPARAQLPAALLPPLPSHWHIRFAVGEGPKQGSPLQSQAPKQAGGQEGPPQPPRRVTVRTGGRCTVAQGHHIGSCPRELNVAQAHHFTNLIYSFITISSFSSGQLQHDGAAAEHVPVQSRARPPSQQAAACIRYMANKQTRAIDNAAAQWRTPPPSPPRAG